MILMFLQIHFYCANFAGIFLYGDDWRILRDASQLLTLVVIAEVILSRDGNVSVPGAAAQNMKLPFQIIPYGENNAHEKPSCKGTYSY